MIFNPGYLECLHRPNVTLTYDGIETLTERGIKLKTGEEVPLDVVIFATGYQVVSTNVPEPKCELNWSSVSSREAYKCRVAKA